MQTPADRHTPRIAALLEKTRRNRGRLIFALDATMSRQPTWDAACQLQSEMFAEVAKIGALEIQLTWFRGHAECKSSAWTLNADELARAMRRVTCEAGYTQIGKILTHARAEHVREKVAGVIYIGDATEEMPSSLFDAAIGQPPWFLFQEGHDAEVTTAFKELARLTNGAYERFDAGAAAKLGELLRAVAAFCVGGQAALAGQNTDGARLLLGQLR